MRGVGDAQDGDDGVQGTQAVRPEEGRGEQERGRGRRPPAGRGRRGRARRPWRAPPRRSSRPRRRRRGRPGPMGRGVPRVPCLIGMRRTSRPGGRGPRGGGGRSGMRGWAACVRVVARAGLGVGTGPGRRVGSVATRPDRRFVDVGTERDRPPALRRNRAVSPRPSGAGRPRRRCRQGARRRPAHTQGGPARQARAAPGADQRHGRTRHRSRELPARGGQSRERAPHQYADRDRVDEREARHHRPPVRPAAVSEPLVRATSSTLRTGSWPSPAAPGRTPPAAAARSVR